jgi:hypothetical protein
MRSGAGLVHAGLDEVIQRGVPDTLASRAADPVRIRWNTAAGPMGLVSDKRAGSTVSTINIALASVLPL